MKKTVVIGASPNPTRYSWAACRMLNEEGHECIPVGIKKGEMFGKQILDLRTKPPINDVHTVTLYINPINQRDWYNYILSLKPKRIIFNPGTENPALARLAEEAGIDVEFACNLVLLSTGQF